MFCQYSYNLSGARTFYNFPRDPISVSGGRYRVNTESHRSVSKGATLYTELLATKNKLQCSWNYLTPDELASILNVFEGRQWVVLKHFNPLNKDQLVEKVYYCGDAEYTVALMTRTVNGVSCPIGYQSLTWNFIER